MWARPAFVRLAYSPKASVAAPGAVAMEAPFALLIPQLGLENATTMSERGAFSMPLSRKLTASALSSLSLWVWPSNCLKAK
jgi:hypothetical protein